VLGPSRPADASTGGFWLGGVTLGVPGFILGAYLPHHHLVTTTFSVLWWGL
jgi:hypothetical protein